MKCYFLMVFCVVAQMNAMEQSIEHWSHDPIVYNSFEQFLGKIDSYKTKTLVGGLLSEAPVLCMVNDNKYVVRRFKGSEDDRRNQLNAYLLATNKGVAPKIYHHVHHDDLSFITMEFVDAPTLSHEQANNPKIIDIIANKIRVIAQFDANIVTHNRENYFDETLHHCENIKKKDFVGFDVVLEEIKNKIEVIHQEIDKHKRSLVIGHNDFHPRNMFFINNDILVIDWDLLGLNYEFGDLAGYSIFSCLNKENEARLLREYLLQIPSKADQQYFQMVKLLARACLAVSFFDIVKYIPEATSVESIKDFKHYAAIFADSVVSDSSDFFYECGMSQLQELRREYEEFERA